MHPFTVKELGADYDLERAPQFGTLPAIHELSTPEATDVLKAYVEVYLREEIQFEGLVRNVGGYTRFLDLAAAYSGQTLNISSVARDAGIAPRTVQSYFEVLEDTLITRTIPAWRRSPLKRLAAHPRVYLFDTGVTNALTGRLHQPLNITDRGRLFEQLMVLEAQRRLDYAGTDARLYYWRTNSGAEVDLLIEHNGAIRAAFEFKSGSVVASADCSGLTAFADDYPQTPRYLVCTCPQPFRMNDVQVLPWRAYMQLLEDLST